MIHEKPKPTQDIQVDYSNKSGQDATYPVNFIKDIHNNPEWLKDHKDNIKNHWENLRLSQDNERLRQEARTDALTGLGNRRAYEEDINTIFEATPEPGVFALLVIDIDGFKAVNDNLGHDAGDEALKRIASNLKKSLRHGDMIYRLGGDEFGILLSFGSNEDHENFSDEYTDSSDLRTEKYLSTIRQATELVHTRRHPKPLTSELVESVGRRLLDEASQGEEIHRVEAYTSSSLGLAINEEGDTPETLFKRADEAVYSDKSDKNKRLNTLRGSRAQKSK